VYSKHVSILTIFTHEQTVPEHLLHGK